MGELFIMSKDETLGFARGMLKTCSDVPLKRFYESVIHYLENDKSTTIEDQEKDIDETLKKLREQRPIIPVNITPISIVGDDGIPPACRGCRTHPSNGGDGICNCILGLPQITC